MPFVAADAILGATTVRQITQASHRTGNEHRKAMTSGGAIVQQVSGLRAEEVTTLTTGDIATLLALGTNTFISQGIYLSASTITVPFKARDQGALFKSGNNHSHLTGAAALIIPTAIEASQDAEFATLQFEVHWLSSDGTTAGATGSSGNALGAQSFLDEFALGPCYINASELTGVQSWRCTPGITLVKSSHKGLIRPTHISIQSVMPTLEVTLNDIDGIAATVNAFTAMTSANFYLRKRKDAAIYEPAVSSEDIRLTFAGGLTDTNQIEVNDNNDGTVTITCHGKALTSSVAAAIP